MVSEQNRLLVDYLNQVSFQRGRFALAGLILSALGIGLLFSPVKTMSIIAYIESYALIVVGILMIVLAVFRIKTRRIFFIGIATTIAGAILAPIAHLWPDKWLWIFAIATGFVGIFKLVLIFKDWTRRKKYFLVSGVIDVAAAVLAIVFNNAELLRILLGIIFTIVGIEFIRFSLSPAHIPDHIKELRKKYNKEHFSFRFRKRIPGEVYGAYLGGGYHAGIYVGENMVVHFTDKNIVSHVSWEVFSEGRPVKQMSYPDIPEVLNKEIINYALSQVGKKYDYDGVSYNCENFTIQCRSLGATTTSMFAQTKAALSVMNTSPHLGLVLEFVSRALERPAFTKGGKHGQKLALKLRSIRSLVTRTILYRKELSKY